MAAAVQKLARPLFAFVLLSSLLLCASTKHRQRRHFESQSTWANTGVVYALPNATTYLGYMINDFQSSWISNSFPGRSIEFKITNKGPSPAMSANFSAETFTNLLPCLCGPNTLGCEINIDHGPPDFSVRIELNNPFVQQSQNRHTIACSYQNSSVTECKWFLGHSLTDNLTVTQSPPMLSFSSKEIYNWTVCVLWKQIQHDQHLNTGCLVGDLANHYLVQSTNTSCTEVWNSPPPPNNIVIVNSQNLCVLMNPTVGPPLTTTEPSFPSGGHTTSSSNNTTNNGGNQSEGNEFYSIIIGVVTCFIVIVVAIALLLVRYKYKSEASSTESSERSVSSESTVRKGMNNKLREQSSHGSRTDSPGSAPSYIRGTQGWNFPNGLSVATGSRTAGRNTRNNTYTIHSYQGNDTAETASEATVYASIHDTFRTNSEYFSLDSSFKYNHSYTSLMGLANDPRLRPPMPLPRRVASQPLPYYSFPQLNTGRLSNQNSDAPSPQYLELIGEKDAPNQPISRAYYISSKSFPPSTAPNKPINMTYYVSSEPLPPSTYQSISETVTI